MTNRYRDGIHLLTNDLQNYWNHGHPYKNGGMMSGGGSGGKNGGKNDGRGHGIHFYGVGGCDAHAGQVSSF